MTSLVIVGRIRKAHGVRGEVVVECMTESPDALFASGARLFAGTTSGDPAPDGVALTVESVRPFGDLLLMAFEEIADRTDAERWRDRYLLVPEGELVPPAEDEVYVHDLVGLELVAAGKPLGVVVGTFEVAGRLLLEVKRGDGTTLVPYDLEFVEHVDLPGRTLAMRLPEGLLD